MGTGRSTRRIFTGPGVGVSAVYLLLLSLDIPSVIFEVVA